MKGQEALDAEDLSRILIVGVLLFKGSRQVVSLVPLVRSDMIGQWRHPCSADLNALVASTHNFRRLYSVITAFLGTKEVVCVLGLTNYLLPTMGLC